MKKGRDARMICPKTKRTSIRAMAPPPYSPRCIDKILFEHELFGMTRFLIHLSFGTMPHAPMLRAIELHETVMTPAVRKALA